MKPYLTHEHPLRLAHRGGAALWPENTMVAFQGAVDLGYRYLESDLHVTRDGVIVMFHDRRLDRLTNGSGPVSAWLWADLRRLDAAYYFAPDEGFPLRGRGHGIPRLDDCMAAFPDRLFNVDIKQPRTEEVVAEFVLTGDRVDRVLVGSFNSLRLARFRRLTDGRVATSAGSREAGAFWLASRRGRATRLAADALQVPVRWRGRGVVDARLVEAAHSRGHQVHVWTVDDPQAMAELLDLGVDGIVTDRPDLLNAVVAEREQAT